MSNESNFTGPENNGPNIFDDPTTPGMGGKPIANGIEYLHVEAGPQAQAQQFYSIYHQGSHIAVRALGITLASGTYVNLSAGNLYAFLPTSNLSPGGGTLFSKSGFTDVGKIIGDKSSKQLMLEYDNRTLLARAETSDDVTHGGRLNPNNVEFVRFNPDTKTVEVIESTSIEVASGPAFNPVLSNTSPITPTTGEVKQPSIVTALDANFNVTEDGPPVTTNLIATSSDPSDTVSFALDPNSPSNASVTPDGILTYDPDDDHQQLSYSQVEEVQIAYIATSSQGTSDTATATINVQGVNDAVTISGVTTSLTLDESTTNAATTIIDSDVTLADPDSAHFNTGNLTLGYAAGGGAEDQLTIANQGTGSGQIGVSGSNITYEGNTIGTFTGGTGGTSLVVTFTTTNATPTAVDALVQALQYQNTSDTPTASRTLRLTVNDGTDTSANYDIGVTVNAENDVPIAIADTNSMSNEDLNATGNVLTNDSDPDGDTITVTTTGNTSGKWGTLNLSSNGSYTYTPIAAAMSLLGAGYTVSDAISYTITDTNSATANSTLTINITGANTTPTANATIIKLGKNDFTSGQLGGTDPNSNHSSDELIFEINGVKTSTIATTSGQITNFNSVTGEYTYTPNSDFIGTDSFTFTVTDPSGAESSAATASITVVSLPYGTTPANETLVNTTTNDNQMMPAIGKLSGGGFVVTWEGEGISGDDPGIFAQRYDSNAAKVGGEIAINEHTDSTQAASSVAGLDSDKFVVTWQSKANTDSDTNDFGVSARIFNANGTPATSELQVNTSFSGAQVAPDIVTLNNGNFVVTWQSDHLEGNGDIVARIFNSAGTAQTAEITVNATWDDGEAQEAPVISTLNDGGFVIAWQDKTPGNYDIHAQRFTAAGAKNGTEIIVNATTADDQELPDIATLSNGDFVVVWQSNNDNVTLDDDNYGIFMQRFNSSGVAQGTETLVNSYTTKAQINPSITALQTGGFLITWDSDGQDGDHEGVYGQQFDSAGAKVGSEFALNVRTTDEQRFPAITELNNGNVQTVWSSKNQDGNHEGIYLSTLTESVNSPQTLTGGAYNDSLKGGMNNDTLNGHGGDDRLEGKAGADTINGGDGTDTASYAASAAGVTVDLSIVGPSPQVSAGDASGDMLTSIENLIGSNYADTLTGDGNANRLEGGGDNDSLSGADGDDVLIGGAGSDILDGGSGNDWVSFEDLTALVTANLSGSAVSGGDTDTLSNIENLRGTDFNDALTGDASANIFEGGLGADTISGGDGIDTASYENSLSANDIDGVTVNLTTGVNTGNDAQGDTLNSIENLIGSDFADALTGDATANTITLGRGGTTGTKDTAEGAAGADIFEFTLTDGYDSGHNDVYGNTQAVADAGSWTDAIQLNGATAGGPVTQMTGAQGDWLLATSDAYITGGTTLTFTNNDGSGTITLSDGSTITFTDIDEIRWG